ncbi:hypothetical protein WN943_000044 [Citrus x changshan-huyou]
MEIKSVKLNQSHTRTQKDYSGFTDLGHNQAYIHCEKENELSLIRLYKIQDTNIVEKLSLTRSDHITDHEALHTTRNCSRNIPQRPAHRFWGDDESAAKMFNSLADSVLIISCCSYCRDIFHNVNEL